MNLKNNKGYTGVDILISTLVLIIFIPLITATIFNTTQNNSLAEKKGQAINIASNILEISKSIDINKINSNVLDENNVFYTELNARYGSHLVDGTTIAVEDEKMIFSIHDNKNNHYKIHIQVKDYKDYEENIDKSDIIENIVKKVTVMVEYRSNGETKSIEMSTIKALE